jgi:hypothetical protein
MWSRVGVLQRQGRRRPKYEPDFSRSSVCVPGNRRRRSRACDNGRSPCCPRARTLVCSGNGAFPRRGRTKWTRAGSVEGRSDKFRRSLIVSIGAWDSSAAPGMNESTWPSSSITSRRCRFDALGRGTERGKVVGRAAHERATDFEVPSGPPMPDRRPTRFQSDFANSILIGADNLVASASGK